VIGRAAICRRRVDERRVATTMDAPAPASPRAVGDERRGARAGVSRRRLNPLAW